jgi:two-component system chemotaxis response regulator CheB
LGRKFLRLSGADMPGHDLIVLGASAGGVEPLKQIVRDVPADLPAAICIVRHFPSQSISSLPAILSRVGPLAATHACDGEAIEHGRIYVAPPNDHLIVKDGVLRLGRGPRENQARPAIDPLFRTAARAYGPRVIGVILSGSLDDGTAGLAAVKNAGGIAIVQTPEEALFSGMPQSAIDNVPVDYVMPASQIAQLLGRLAREPVELQGVEAMTHESEKRRDNAEGRLHALQTGELPGPPSPFTCPDCGGPLWERREGGLMRFQCHVGHAFSPDALLSAESDSLEQALWTALRALEENAALARHIAQRMRGRDNPRAAARFDERSVDLERRAGIIRQVLLAPEPRPATITPTVDSTEMPPPANVEASP